MLFLDHTLFPFLKIVLSTVLKQITGNFSHLAQPLLLYIVSKVQECGSSLASQSWSESLMILHLSCG
jgi:hypothetical protein